MRHFFAIIALFICFSTASFAQFSINHIVAFDQARFELGETNFSTHELIYYNTKTGSIRNYTMGYGSRLEDFGIGGVFSYEDETGTEEGSEIVENMRSLLLQNKEKIEKKYNVILIIKLPKKNVFGRTEFEFEVIDCKLKAKAETRFKENEAFSKRVENEKLNVEKAKLNNLLKDLSTP